MKRFVRGDVKNYFALITLALLEFLGGESNTQFVSGHTALDLTELHQSGLA